MSELAYSIILIVALTLSVLPILLLIKKAIKVNNRNASKIIVESKSGVRIELDLYERNDKKKIHQTVEMLLEK